MINRPSSVSFKSLKVTVYDIKHEAEVVKVLSQYKCKSPITSIPIPDPEAYFQKHFWLRDRLSNDNVNLLLKKFKNKVECHIFGTRKAESEIYKKIKDLRVEVEKFYD